MVVVVVAVVVVLTAESTVRMVYAVLRGCAFIQAPTDWDQQR